MRRALMVACLVMPLAAGVGYAQGDSAGRSAVRPQRALRQEQKARKQAMQGTPRQRLEQQVRQQFWKAAKNRIGFTDDQMAKLEQTSLRFDQRRKALAQAERAQRVAMRREIMADSAVNQTALAGALDQLQQIQHRRADMLADEQKEYATFMTPLQRAKFLGLQEQVRKRMQELVKARPDSAPGALAPTP
jgi:hypothetical protein